MRRAFSLRGLDLYLSRRVQRRCYPSTGIYATLVVRSRRGSSGTRRSTDSGSDDRCFGALAQDLSGNRADRGATYDLLDILALRLVPDLVHLCVAGGRTDRVRLAAEADRHDTEAHHDIVVRVLATLELCDFDQRRRALWDHSSVRAGHRLCQRRVEALSDFAGIRADRRA